LNGQAKPAPSVAVASSASKKKEGAPEKVKAKRVDKRNIVLPRPPMFPRKNEEPVPVYPKILSNKKQFKIEFELKASPRMLYNYLSTPSGLGAWFANDVNIRDGVFTFFWNGSSARAHIIVNRENQLVCFQWLDETDNSYFVFE